MDKWSEFGQRMMQIGYALVKEARELGLPSAGSPSSITFGWDDGYVNVDLRLQSGTVKAVRFDEFPEYVVEYIEKVTEKQTAEGLDLNEVIHG